MHTSVTCLAVALLLSGAGPDESLVHRSYHQALEAGQRLGKPLAIFVVKGAASYEQTLQEGQTNPELMKVLAEQYVSVVIDAAEAENQALVAALKITKEAGVVISDRKGQVQAYHHDGRIAQSELARNLRQFADPALVVNTTLSNAIETRFSYYPDARMVQPVYHQPTYQEPRSYQPAPVMNFRPAAASC